MGKYNVGPKEMRPKDYWPTMDPDAICSSLIPFIRGKRYAEPCAGEGHLIDLLMEVAICDWASDIRDTPHQKKDALDITKSDLKGSDLIITNPPFSWDYLQPLLDHFIELKPTWLLLPADFMHNKRMSPYMKQCSWVLSIGRLFWVLEGGNESMRGKKGKDNFCWYYFTSDFNGTTRFIGR